MDKNILKLLPQKAFKLISAKETFKIGTAVTKSVLDKNTYEKNFNQLIQNWKLDEILLVQESPKKMNKSFTKDDGENILKIYFAQFYGSSQSVHLDLRSSSFAHVEKIYWIPSKLSYSFQPKFVQGVRLLYEGFYFDNHNKFRDGLSYLTIIRDDMDENQKNEVIKLFFAHFGEGKNNPVKFSLKKLNDSFNSIFTHFLTNDIPLNPEFAVLGAMLVTLYQTLQEINEELNVRDAFLAVYYKYQ